MPKEDTKSDKTKIDSIQPGKGKKKSKHVPKSTVINKNYQKCANQWLKARGKKMQVMGDSYWEYYAKLAKKYHNLKTDEERLQYNEEQRKNMNHKISYYKSRAKKYRIKWLLDDDYAKQLFSKNCAYCNCPPDEYHNGIDRIDNDHGYDCDNVVPCCTICNIIKGTLDIDIFFKRIVSILTNLDKIDGKIYSNVFPSSKSKGYGSYMHHAESKKLPFTLSEDDYYSLISKTCYYCSLPSYDKNINGIDRIDSNIGYIPSNCRTCCAECNYMKNNYSETIFINKLMAIYKYHKKTLDRIYVNDMASNLLNNNQACKVNKNDKMNNNNDIDDIDDIIYIPDIDDCEINNNNDNHDDITEDIIDADDPPYDSDDSTILKLLSNSLYLFRKRESEDNYARTDIRFTNLVLGDWKCEKRDIRKNYPDDKFFVMSSVEFNKRTDINKKKFRTIELKTWTDFHNISSIVLSQGYFNDLYYDFDLDANPPFRITYDSSLCVYPPNANPHLIYSVVYYYDHVVEISIGADTTRKSVCKCDICHAHNMSKPGCKCRTCVSHSYHGKNGDHCHWCSPPLYVDESYGSNEERGTYQDYLDKINGNVEIVETGPVIQEINRYKDNKIQYPNSPAIKRNFIGKDYSNPDIIPRTKYVIRSNDATNNNIKDIDMDIDMDNNEGIDKNIVPKFTLNYAVSLDDACRNMQKYGNIQGEDGIEKKIDMNDKNNDIQNGGKTNDSGVKNVNNIVKKDVIVSYSASNKAALDSILNNSVFDQPTNVAKSKSRSKN